MDWIDKHIYNASTICSSFVQSFVWGTIKMEICKVHLHQLLFSVPWSKDVLGWFLKSSFVKHSIWNRIKHLVNNWRTVLSCFHFLGDVLVFNVNVYFQHNIWSKSLLFSHCSLTIDKTQKLTFHTKSRRCPVERRRYTYCWEGSWDLA